MRVAVLGLGVIGSGIATSLLRHTHEVTVWNRTASKAAALVAAGARLAATPAEAVAEAEVVLSAVSDDHASRAVWLGSPSPGAARPALADRPQGELEIGSSTLPGQRPDPAQRHQRDAGRGATLGMPAQTAGAERPPPAGGSADSAGEQPETRSVWPGALAAAGERSVLVECSTLSLRWVRELAEQARARRLRLLDAPVSGTRQAAEAGELLLLIGGDPRDIQAAQPVFEAIGRATIHFGRHGNGTLFKLVNNLQSAIQIIALAEGLRLAERGGLDLSLAIDTLGQGRPGSPLVRSKAPRMASRDYARVDFSLQWMLKDVEYILSAASEFELDLPLLQSARAILARAVAQGLGAQDVSALAEIYR